VAKGQKSGGRVKGTPNKVHSSIKDAVLETFRNLGGPEHMTKWASENPNEFYKLAARLIPTEVNAVIENNHYVIETPAHTDTTDVWQQQHAPKSIM
jgi:hypothetical protein